MADHVRAMLGLMAKGEVGVDSVKAFVLQVVGLELLHEPDTAALLVQV